MTREEYERYDAELTQLAARFDEIKAELRATVKPANLGSRGANSWLLMVENRGTKVVQAIEFMRAVLRPGA
jgi:hypothetical protein